MILRMELRVFSIVFNSLWDLFSIIIINVFMRKQKDNLPSREMCM